MARVRNPNIRKPNVEMELTIEQVNELLKCMKDPVYFIKNYVQIQHPLKGTIPFDLYPYQEKMIRSYQEERYTIVLSARQTGKCCLANTLIPIINRDRISKIKKILLYIIDRKTYNEIYQNMQTLQ